MKPGTKHLQGLEAQLAEKDELIEALTGQLELAVERLDRLRRAGADRPHAASHADSQAGLANRELTSRLTGVIEEWEELRPTDRMDRIETGIAKLLEMVAERPLVNIAPPPISYSNFALTAESQLFQAPPQPYVSEPAPAASVELATTPLDDLDLFSEPLDPPHPVANEADLPTVLSAIENRDRYIQYLTARVRRVESKKSIPVDWELLADAPDEYRKKLQALEAMLHDHLRQAEIANALERADLTRERAKLQQLKQTLESQIRRLVPNQQPEPTPPERPERPTKTEVDNRWKRLFSR